MASPAAPTSPAGALRVRVVPVRERRGLAWVVGTVGGLALVWLTATHGPGERAVLAGVAALGALWMLGLLLCFRPAPYVAIPALTLDGVRLGSALVGRDAVASVVKARTGVSVALVSSDDELFVETATMNDAMQLVRMTSAPLVDTFSLRLRSRALRTLKRIAAGIGTLACVALPMMEYEVAIFGVLVFSGLVTSLVHVAESLWRRRTVVALGQGLDAASGALGEHVLLHATRPTNESPEEPRIRIQVLDRSDEPVRMWLERIDGLSSDAYRGALPSQADLRLVFEDPAAPLHQRLAAARLLVRRYSVRVAELHDALEPELVRYFLDIDADDTEVVAASIERPGPRFRAE